MDGWMDGRMDGWVGERIYDGTDLWIREDIWYCEFLRDWLISEFKVPLFDLKVGGMLWTSFNVLESIQGPKNNRNDKKEFSEKHEK